MPIPRSLKPQRLPMRSVEKGHGDMPPWPTKLGYERTYFLGSSCFTGTAQPPLPLQEFLPAQPASPDLQPPWPLHSFLPLQSCLAAVAQPPLPLQEFLPAQPASPDLQPPLPLHSFMPLQACLSPAAAFFSSAANTFV